MNRVDSMVAARDEISVKFKQFMDIIKVSKTPMVFEGEDGKYYTSKIDNFFSKPWDSIDAGGKSKVLKLREKVKSNPTYKNKLALYFVDADFSDNVNIMNEEDIYITPCYSVENFYFSENLIEKVLRDEFKVSPSNEEKEDFDKAIQTFRILKSQYLDAITSFNELIYFIRTVYQKNNPNKTRLNINNVKFTDLVKISLTKVSKIYDESNPRNIFKDLEDNVVIDFEVGKKFFDGKDNTKAFRGKQNLEFIRTFLECLKKDRVCATNRELFTKKAGVKLGLSKENCLSELSQYADTPNCLRNFLMRNSNLA